MVCASAHGADDCCYHAPFALWVHGNGFPTLGRELHVRMHPLQALQHPVDGLVLGRLGKIALDRNDTSWCVPLSMELMIAAGLFHLPCGCMATDQQASSMAYLTGCVPFSGHIAQ